MTRYFNPDKAPEIGSCFKPVSQMTGSDLKASRDKLLRAIPLVKRSLKKKIDKQLKQIEKEELKRS